MSEVIRILLPIIAIILLVAGCSKGEAPSRPATTASAPSVAAAPAASGCQACHPIKLDQAHRLACPRCHQGNAQATAKEAAHAGLVSQPAHPEQMAAVCGPCHPRQVEAAARSLHFTLAREVNLVRRAFGAREELTSITEIPRHSSPKTALALADDLLRRRCLACHVYDPGDPYPATRHGTGCAACHLAFRNGKLAEHAFLARPTDDQCLSCHYGNRVGSDYHGRFEHDYHSDFDTPFQPGGDTDPPYGVRFHQLTPDLHQKAGLACIDCHGGRELMADGRPVACLDCHGPAIPQDSTLKLRDQDGRRLLTTRASGKQLAVPLLRDPAHRRYGAKVACEVCHAQWSFADHGDYLLRQDEADFESPWSSLIRQGNWQVEQELNAVFNGNGLDGPPSMTDRVAGGSSRGLWLQTYELRRWEEVNTCRDHQGVLQVCRPLLDLNLSYVNAQGEVVIDGATPVAGTNIMQPYTPHTTGPAGNFYWRRLDAQADR